jgi:GNAT superfamily N-acetyltransferase
MNVQIRTALEADKAQMEALIPASVQELSREEYTPEQIEAALKTVFGIDSELINDGTYFVVVEIDSTQEADRRIVACGGWSKRKTLFGGDQFAARESQELDPATDAAKIRAFFVHPDYARRGIGSLLLEHCELAAKQHGFSHLELMGTLPGVKLYQRHGFIPKETILHDAGSGVMIPFVPMTKQL